MALNEYEPGTTFTGRMGRTIGESPARRVRPMGVLAIAMSVVCPTALLAQLNGQNIKGDAGLKSGSQAPPGAYFVVPMWFYNADKLKDRDGNELSQALSGSLNASVLSVAFSRVTTKKLFGANYAFLAALAWANNRVQGAEDFDSDPGAGLTDAFVQPINLGWHWSRADVTAAYGVYVPIGRYEDGADDNTGLGMWGQELLIGGTLFLNQKKSLHLATTATFDFQSSKKDSDTKVGNIMNLEGGAGVDFLGGGLSVGLAYYGTFKLTEDRFDSQAISNLASGKNSVWALGPEASLALAWGGKVHGFLTVRYEWEMDAKLTTEGDAWNVALVLPLKAIPIPK
jgi:hypothetical protein